MLYVKTASCSTNLSTVSQVTGEIVNFLFDMAYLQRRRGAPRPSLFPNYTADDPIRDDIFVRPPLVQQ